MADLGFLGWLVPLLGLIGALAGGMLTPWVGALMSGRAARRRAFDKAIAAIQAVQLARYYATGISAEYLGLKTGDRRASAFSQRVREREVERYIDLMYEAKAALAELAPHYVPRGWQPEWEIGEDDAKTLVTELTAARSMWPRRPRTAPAPPAVAAAASAPEARA